MKSTELRIGNFLYYSELNNISDYMVVTAIYENCVITDWNEPDECDGMAYSLEAVLAIPLTEEWLLKFGFVDLSTDKNGFGLRLRLNDTDELCWYKQGDMLWYQTINSGFVRDYNINHAHQLQNLYFALTGEELKLTEL